MKKYPKSSAFLTLPFLSGACAAMPGELPTKAAESPPVTEEPEGRTGLVDEESYKVFKRVGQVITDNLSGIPQEPNLCAEMQFGECVEMLVRASIYRVIQQQYIFPISMALQEGDIAKTYEIEEKLAKDYPEENWHYAGLGQEFASHAERMRLAKAAPIEQIIELLSKGIHYWEKTREQVPRDAEVNEVLGALYMQKTNAMLKTINKSANDINSEFLHQNFRIFAELLNAIMQFETAIENGADKYKALIYLYSITGNYNKLDEISQEYYEKLPDDPAVHFRLAVMNWHLGNIEEAKRIFANMLEKFGEDKLDSSQLSAIADFFIHNGMREEGTEMYEKLIDSSEKIHPSVYWAYALHFPNDMQKAIQILEKGLEKYPGVPEFLEKLEELRGDSE